MENKFNKGIKDLQNIKMTTEEKKVLFERIQIDIESFETKLEKKIVSPWNIHVLGVWMHTSRLAFAGALALVITLTGGTLAYAAESALPGDILYPVKVRITEPVRNVLATNTEQEAQWQAEKVLRRMKEAETLAADKKFDVAKEKEVKELIEKHTKNLTKKLNTLRENNSENVADEISVKFQSEMNARAEVIDVIDSQENKIDESNAYSVADSAREIAKIVGKKIGKRKISHEEGKKSVEDIIKTTSSEIDNFATNTTSFRKKIIHNTQETLKQAQKLLEESTDQNNKGDFEKASNSLLDSNSKAEEARIFMKRGLDVSDQLRTDKKNRNVNKNKEDQD